MPKVVRLPAAIWGRFLDLLAGLVYVILIRRGRQR